MKHTEGSWHVSNTMDKKTLLICDIKGNMVAEVDLNHILPKEEAQANAALIAQSPRLLEIVKEEIDALHDLVKQEIASSSQMMRLMRYEEIYKLATIIK